jgi:hypothetical protein
MKSMLKSLLLSPPAALSQGIAQTAVNHEFDVVLLAPDRQGITRTAVDHVVNVFALRGDVFKPGIFFPGLSPFLCVVETSGWPIWDRLTAVNPVQVVWPHDMPQP